jgi:opacity protein-like surface antigen
MSTRIRVAGFLLTGLILAAAPASAQVVQSVQFGGGFFVPRGFDSRATGDVLVRDAIGQPLNGDPTLSDALIFDMSDFRTGHLFGEWNVGFGNHLEVAANVGFSRRSVPTIYADVIDENGRDIDQTLQLRSVPLTAVVRFLPFGQPGDVQPYVGAGVGAVFYRYSEFGSFVDTDTLEIFNDRFTTTGTAPAWVILGGVRFPIGGDIYALNLEGKYLHAVGDTGGLDKGFLDDKIDLSGGMFNIGFQVRF